MTKERTIAMTDEQHRQTRPRGGADSGPIRPVVRALAALRARARALLLAERGGAIAACVIAAIIVAASADYFLRAPAPVRTGGWCVGIGLLLWALLRMVVPALRFRPALTDMALRVENTEAGRRAALRGVLASGIDFASTGEGGRFGSTVASEAARRFENTDRAGVRRELLRTGPARRSLLLLGAALIVAAGSWAATPTLASIGLRRVVTPWASPEWPRRTKIVDATGETVHPAGTAVALRAGLVRSDQPARQTRVVAHYRVDAPGRTGTERTAVLAFQEQRIATETDAGADLFLRLVEPALADAPGPDTRLVYWFETKDDRTPERSILLVEPPAIVGATAMLEPPAYMGDVSDPLRLDLGAGQDERAAPEEALAGSTLTLTLELNKTLPGVPEQDPGAWAHDRLGPQAGELVRSGRATLRTDGTMWTLTTRLDETLPIEVSLVDEYGIGSGEMASYLLRTRRDAPPSATVVEPLEDRSVLPTAVVDVRGEARDDVRLSLVSLERVLARPVEGSRSTEPEQSEGAVVMATGEPGPGAPPEGLREVSVGATLNLADLGVRPGDEVRLSVLASDAFELDGARHEAVRSLERRLTIISQQEFTEQIWGALASVRREAMQADERQQEAGESTERAFAAERSGRMQAEVSERVRAASEAVAQARERVRENRLDDGALDAVLRDTQAALEGAGEASVRAGESLDELADAERDEGPDTERAGAAREGARASQEEVRDRLGELVEMLNQGQDMWSVRRDLERALQQQRELREQTGATGQRTTGRDPSQLSPSERAELAEQAAQQRELGERLEEAVRSMLEQAQEMSEADPAGAQAMAEAAARAQRQGVSEKMEQASEEIQQNQTNNATSSQDEAIESMENMLQDLAEGEKNRDQVLRRQLASLMESLDGLIAQQRTELSLLSNRLDAGEGVDGLDRGMIRVNQNTLGVLDEASGSARAIAPVIEKIEEASGEQVGAITLLRRAGGADADNEGARGHEQASLDALLAAKEQAEQIDQEAAEREALRKRDNLKRAYQEALTEQVLLRDESVEMSRAELDRRARARARANADVQSGLRDRIDQIRQATSELGDTVMFDYAHTRLDEAMGEAADRLRQSQVDTRTVLVQDRSVRLLKSLLEALEDPEKDDRFRENEQPQQQGQGQGEGQQQEPKVTPDLGELLLLRAMQVEALDLTSMASEATPADREMLSRDAASLQGELARRAESLLNPDSLGGEKTPWSPPEGGVTPGDKTPEPGATDPTTAPMQGSPR